MDEQTFAKQIGDLDESISGSDSSESDDEETGKVQNGDNTLTALLRRQAKISQQDHEDGFVTSKPKKGAGNVPMLWLSSSKLSNDTALGIYKAVLSDVEQEEAPNHLVEMIQKKQLTPVSGKHSGTAQINGKIGPAKQSPHVFLCMIGGGHFAAMIVDLAPEIRRGPGGVEERHAIVKAHKTFHRYTTRRKQGGSQSANDNAKGNAHSVGSSIRRANEVALELEIRSLLSEWKSIIDTAELLFVRASGTTNRRTLFGPYDGQVLSIKDKRLRGFPFSTRRATQAELMRSFTELTKLKVSTLVEAVVEVPEQTPAKPAPAPKLAPPKPSKGEEIAFIHTSQLHALIRRSKAPGMIIYLTKNSLSPNFFFYPASDNHHAPVPLHLAASINASACVITLLTQAGADPTILNADGKTAFDIVGAAHTKDAFRISRHILGESPGYSWDASHVPSPITQQEADRRAAVQKKSDDAAEAQRRASELEKIKWEEEERNTERIERKAGKGQNLASVEKTAEERRMEEARGLTPEMRARLERERRARAAEERMKRLQGGT